MDRGASALPIGSIWLLSLLLLPVGYEARGAVSAAEAKAEFVFRIVQFVDWDVKSGDKQFEIAVLEDEGFVRVLSKVVRGREIKGLKISIRRIEESADIGEARVVFVPGTNRRTISNFIKGDLRKDLLTLGESEAFLKAGGMVSIVVSRVGKIRLASHRETLERAGLKISSKLMRILAR